MSCECSLVQICVPHMDVHSKLKVYWDIYSFIIQNIKRMVKGNLSENRIVNQGPQRKLCTVREKRTSHKVHIELCTDLGCARFDELLTFLPECAQTWILGATESEV